MAKPTDEVGRVQDIVLRDALRCARSNFRAQGVELEGLSETDRLRYRQTLRNSAALAAFALQRAHALLWWDLPPKTGYRL